LGVLLLAALLGFLAEHVEDNAKDQANEIEDGNPEGLGDKLEGEDLDERGDLPGNLVDSRELGPHNLVNLLVVALARNVGEGVEVYVVLNGGDDEVGDDELEDGHDRPGHPRAQRTQDTIHQGVQGVTHRRTHKESIDCLLPNAGGVHSACRERERERERERGGGCEGQGTQAMADYRRRQQEAAGGCSRRLQQETAAGDCSRRMQEEDAGGGCCSPPNPFSERQYL